MKWKKAFNWGAFIFTGLVTILTIVYWSYTSYTVPTINGELELRGLTSKVKVLRDKEGIPHIFAGQESDAMVALGYLMASERLFQMDIYRRLGKGQLSEVLGDRTLKIDRLFRTMGLNHYADLRLKRDPPSRRNPQMWSLLLAFHHGVNQFVNSGPLPYEFQLLRYRPKPFSASDTYAFLGYMAYSFGIGLKQDIFFSSLAKKISSERLEELRVEPQKFSKRLFALKKSPDWSILEQLISYSDYSLPAFEGSNAWALAGHKSESGGALLASDPHIGFSLPNIWFEASIHTPKYSIYGHFLPGVPFPVLGHNRNLGWGLTISYVDDMDFYKETVEGDLIKFLGNWVRIGKRTEMIPVKGLPDEKLLIKTGPHGPLLGDLVNEENLSVKWTYHLMENRMLEALYQMGHAKTMSQFKAGIPLGTAPGLNVIYADKEGNIGSWLFGSIPIRPDHVKSDFVLNGANGRDEYTGYLDFDSRPGQENPLNGIIVSANQRPPGSSSSLQGSWNSSDRYDAIKEHLKAREKWSLDDLKSIQTSTVHGEAQWIRDILINALRNKGAHPLIGHLEKWDLKSDIYSKGATVYHLLNREIKRLLLDEFSDEDFLRYCRLTALWGFYKRNLKKPNGPWWDLKKTRQIKEDRDQIINLAFIEVESKLKKGNGLEWGDWHQVQFTHPLGRSQPFDKIFNLGPYPAPGGYNIPNNFRWVGCKDGHRAHAGPSTRRLIDFSAPDISWGILPLGISGHPRSPFYKNQMDRFLEGKYRRQWFDPVDIEKSAIGRLFLVPKK